MSKSNLEGEFRKIPSLQFLYEVNEDGSIIRNVKSKRPLKQFKNRHNSPTEHWCTQVNIKKHIRKVFLHKVVAECWLGPRPEGLEVDHIDQNSLNNHYTNLRYVTRSINMRNRTIQGRSFDRMLNNLAIKNGIKIVPVNIIGNGYKYECGTSRVAAKLMASFYPGTKVKSFSDKFHLRRKHIFDYDIEYPSVETAHGNPLGKEQSAKEAYLVGTMAQWNDAKKAEERDRVKHV